MNTIVHRGGVMSTASTRPYDGAIGRDDPITAYFILIHTLQEDRIKELKSVYVHHNSRKSLFIYKVHNNSRMKVNDEENIYPVQLFECFT